MHYSIGRGRLGHRLLATLVVPLLLVAILATSFAGGASAQDGDQSAETDPSAVTAGVLDAAPALLDCTTIGTADSSLPAPTALYQLVGEESTARYRVEEELATIGATEAVGETKAIIGQILFDEAGQPLACSRFDVDLRTLRSDDPRRDNYLYGNTLETEQYPLATFVLTAVEGLDGPLVDGETAEFLLIGDLSIHGVTRAVAWEAGVTREGETLTGAAAMTFEMADFAIEQPRAQIVVSVDGTVRLEVDLTATQTE
jgi:polyisoprenoid-binding protein YceI